MAAGDAVRMQAGFCDASPTRTVTCALGGPAPPLFVPDTAYEYAPGFANVRVSAFAVAALGGSAGPAEGTVHPYEKGDEVQLAKKLTLVPGATLVTDIGGAQLAEVAYGFATPNSA